MLVVPLIGRAATVLVLIFLTVGQLLVLGRDIVALAVTFVLLLSWLR